MPTTLPSSRPDPAELGLVEAVRRALIAAVPDAAIDGIGCLLLDASGALRYTAASDTAAQALEVAEEVCGEGPCHEAFAHGETVVVDVQAERRWVRLGTVLGASPIRTVLAVPVECGGIPVGAVDAFSALPRVWGEASFETVRHTARTIGALIDRALEAELDRQGDELAAAIRAGIEHHQLFARAVRVVSEATGTSLHQSNLRLRQMAAASGADASSLARRALETPHEHGPDAYATTTSDAQALRRAREQLAMLALSDPLTGLANRVLLLNHLELALERSRRAEGRPAIIFCDLDRFKTINDSLGHEVGDEVLRTVAARLSAAVRPHDTVARLGGDEFAILREDVTSEEEAVELADRIAAILAEPHTVRSTHNDDGPSTSYTLTVRASLGVAVAGSEPPPRAAALLRDADMAMYESKRQDPGQVTSFSTELRDAERRRMQIELSLRALLHDRRLTDPLGDGLRLAYQPIVSMRDGRLYSVEALVRWTHPELGEVPAAELISVAENAGLMRQLGAALLHEACTTGAAWRRDHDAEDLVVAVNVSALQLDDPGFVTMVDHALEVSGMPADRLCLELTESHLIVAGGNALGALVDLADRGVGITLDDFGTGYSSLSHLARLPIDGVKIDREFVADLGNDRHATAVIQSVIALARTLDLGIVAEGIETDEQAEQILDLDCELGQGFLYQRAVPPECISQMLVSGRVRHLESA